MKYYWYRLFHQCFRIVRGIGRGFVTLFQWMRPLIERIQNIYRNTLGFWLYKAFFYTKKSYDQWMIGWHRRLAELLTKRTTLQIFLLLVIGVIMIPHSKLYTQDTASLPGRDTLFYHLVGPGDEFEITEETAPSSEQSQVGARWREGVAGIDANVPTSEDPGFLAENTVGITTGGSALTKPIILPGQLLPDGNGTSAGPVAPRTDVETYEVQPGDVIGRIAQRYGVSVNTILWANNLTARSYIRPGDKLTIPPVSGVVHTVKKGDTISKIARTYDTEAEKIIEFNKLQANGADIVIGEDLIIPDGEKPAPAPTRIVTSRPSSLNQVAAPPPSVEAPAGSGFIWPSTVRYISQYFTLKHDGLDIAGKKGSPLYASKAGTVVKSDKDCHWNGGYGCYVMIDHGGGVWTVYGHASVVYVGVGEKVTQGQTIGLMGSTGNSTGPHVHFEVRVNGKKQNPLKYVR